MNALTGVDMCRMLLAEDVAAMLHASPVTIREWARRNKLPCIRLPGTRRVLFPTAWVEAYIAGYTDLEVMLGPDGGRVARPRSCRPSKR